MLQHLSPNKDVIGIVEPHGDFMPPVMAILVVLMILPLTSPVKHAVSMTVFYGTDPLKTVYGTHYPTLSFVAPMVSYSTRKSSTSQWTRLN